MAGARGEPDRRRERPHPVRRRHARVIAVSAVLLLVSPTVVGCGGSGGAAPRIDQVDPSVAADYEFEIPAGAGARIDRGEEFDIFPAELDARVGQTIRIVNDDDRGHNVGPFFVSARSTLTQRFASPGRFVGVCSVHPSGQFVLQVTA